MPLIRCRFTHNTRIPIIYYTKGVSSKLQSMHARSHFSFNNEFNKILNFGVFKYTLKAIFSMSFAIFCNT